MAVTVTPTFETRRFTRLEYERLVEMAVFQPDERLELIDGLLVVREPQDTPHATGVRLVVRVLRGVFGEGWIVDSQLPVALDEYSEPEPDAAVYRRRAVPYKDADRDASDALLLIEVAETSLAYDRSTKLRLYASFGVPEYWVVDCAAEAVEVHRDPASTGYRDVRRIVGAGSVTLQAFPDVVLPLSEIFA